MELGQSHSPAPRLPVAQQNCWGPSPWEGTSVCLLPGKRSTGKVQCGYLLYSGEALFLISDPLCFLCLHLHLTVANIPSSASVTCKNSSPQQDECKTDGAASGPSVLKEELCVLAAGIRTHLAIQHLKQCLMTPSHPRLQKATKAPHLHVVAQRLLGVSADVMMSESERDFIYRCLQDCL